VHNAGVIAKYMFHVSSSISLQRNSFLIVIPSKFYDMFKNRNYHCCSLFSSLFKPLLFLSQVPKGYVPYGDGKIYSEFAINIEDWETIRELATIMWQVAKVVNLLHGRLCHHVSCLSNAGANSA
jgi:hypothetical protein